MAILYAVKLTALADNWGLLPYRRQIIAVSESRVLLMQKYRTDTDITQIVGRPVHVRKTENPTVEQIREVQEAYITELMR
jgi:hypothetical protein